MADNRPTFIITGKARLSYVHLVTPYSSDEGKEPKYSVTVLIPKKDKATLAKIEKAVEAATKEGKIKYWGGKVPKKLKLPLRDGDEEREDDPVFAGHYFLNASSNRKPQVVDSDLDEIMDRDEIYSGMYGRVSINFYPFSAKGNEGVAAGLNNVQKLAEGEQLGGSATTAKADFGGDDEEEDPLA